MRDWWIFEQRKGYFYWMKARVGNLGAGLRLNEVKWSLVVGLSAYDMMLLAENERELQRVADELFYSV